MILGTPITKKFTTGRLWLQFLPGDLTAGFYRDMGNVEDYKPDPKVTRKEHMSSANGVKRTDLSLISDITGKYSLTLDEFTSDLEQLLALGSQGNDAVQNAGNIANEALTANSKQGRVYFTANQGISALVLKVGGVAMVLGTDYSFDAGSGAITILSGGNIADGSAVTVNYTAAAITNHVITGFNNLIQMVNYKLAEYDQFSTTIRRTEIGTGQIYVTNWGENKDDYSKPVIELLTIGQPTILRRAD